MLFIVAQLTIAKIWNHPRYPSTDEANKEYYSFIKKNEILS